MSDSSALVVRLGRVGAGTVSASRLISASLSPGRSPLLALLLVDGACFLMPTRGDQAGKRIPFFELSDVRQCLWLPQGEPARRGNNAAGSVEEESTEDIGDVTRVDTVLVTLTAADSLDIFRIGTESSNWDVQEKRQPLKEIRKALGIAKVSAASSSANIIGVDSDGRLLILLGRGIVALLSFAGQWDAVQPVGSYSLQGDQDTEDDAVSHRVAASTLFSLYHSGIIVIRDASSGTKMGHVDTKALFSTLNGDDAVATNALGFNKLHITLDRRQIVVTSTSGVVCMIDLTQYFILFPHHRVVDDSVSQLGVVIGNRDSMDDAALAATDVLPQTADSIWLNELKGFERAFPVTTQLVSQGPPRAWYENQQTTILSQPGLDTKKSAADLLAIVDIRRARFNTSSTAMNNPEDRLARNVTHENTTAVDERYKDALNSKDSCRIKPVLEPGESVVDAFLSPGAILVPIRVGNLCSKIYVHNLSADTGRTFDFADGAFVCEPSGNDATAYVVTDESIYALVPGVSQQDLLTNAIVFESTALADALCRINEWDGRLLRMHALTSGLRYRQLDVIWMALRGLGVTQRQTACEILVDAIGKYSTQGHYSEFAEQLLLIGLNFMAETIHEAADHNEVSRLQAVAVRLQEARAFIVDRKKPSDPPAGGPSRLRQNPFQTPSPRRFAPGSPGVRDPLLTLPKSPVKSVKKSTKKPTTTASTLQTASGSIVEENVASSAKVKKGSNKKTQPTGFVYQPLYRASIAEWHVDEPLPDLDEAFQVEETRKSGQKSSSLLAPGIGSGNAAKLFEVEPLLSAHRKWGNSDDIEVARYALLSGCVSSAQAYLMARYPLRPVIVHDIDPKHPPPQSRNDETPVLLRIQGTLGEFRLIAAAIVYESLRNNDANTAVTVLESIGMDVAQPLHELMYYSVNPEVRSTAAAELQRRGRLSSAEVELLRGDAMTGGNSEQSSHDFQIFRTRMLKLGRKAAAKSFDRFQCATLKDVPADFIMSPMSPLLLAIEERLPKVSADPHYYWQAPLIWLAHWTEENRALCTFERNVCVSSPSSSDATRVALKFAAWRVQLLDIDKWASAASTVSFQHVAHCAYDRACIRACQLGSALPREALSASSVLRFITLARTIFQDRASHPAHRIGAEKEALDQYLVQLAAQHGLAEALYVYTDFLHLGRTEKEVLQLLSALESPECRATIESKAWTEALLHFRHIAQLKGDTAARARACIRASMACGRACLSLPPGTAKRSITLSDMAAGGRPLMALATLAFIDEPVLDATSIANTALYLPEADLRRLVEPYPELSLALFGNEVLQQEAQNQPVVTAYTLLPRRADIVNAVEVLAWRAVDGQSMPHFGDATVPREEDQANVLEMEVLFYLSKGRPLEALQCSPPDALVDAVIRFALERVDQQRVVAACVLYLLCSPYRDHIDRLRIRISVGQRIAVSAQNLSAAQRRDVIAALISEDSNGLKMVLQLLDSTTLSLMNNLKLETSSLQASALFDVVQLFSRQYGLPLTTTYMELCAARNDWFSLLRHAQEHSVPAQTIVSIVRDHVTGPDLQEHLLSFFARDESTLDGTKIISSSTAAGPLRDLFEIAAKYRDNPDRMLSLAVETNRSFLAVLAAAVLLSHSSTSFCRCTMTDCASAWLRTAEPISGKFIRQTSQLLVGEPVPQFSITDPAGQSTSVKDMLSDLDNEHDSVERFGKLLVLMCSRGKWRSTCDAFSIFDPDSPLLAFFSFALAFHRREDGMAREHLLRFMQVRDKSSHADGYFIGNDTWILRVTDLCCDELLNACPTAYERSKLLDHLHEARYSDDFVHLKNVQHLLGDANIALNRNSDPRQVRDALLRAAKFDSARTYSKEYGIIGEDIVLLEMQHNLRILRASPQYAREQVREDFFLQCHEKFLENRCEPASCGEYFEKLAESDLELPSKERAMLLGLALIWFDGTALADRLEASVAKSAAAGELSMDASSSSFSVGNAKLKPLKRRSSIKAARSSEFLQALENRIWLMTIASDAESQSKTTTLVPGTPLNPRVRSGSASQHLDAVISPGRLGRALSREGGELNDIVRPPIISTAPANPTGRRRPFDFVQSVLERRDFARDLIGDEDDEELDAASMLITPEFDGPSSLTSIQELGAFELIIGRLLDAGLSSQARHLCSHFKQFSHDLASFNLAVAICRGYVAKIDLPGQLRRVLATRKGTPVEDSDFENLDEDGALALLRERVKHAARCLERVQVCYQVSQRLNCTYDVLLSREPLDSLQQLLMLSGSSVYVLAKSYLDVMGVTSKAVAVKLGEILYQILLTHSTSGNADPSGPGFALDPGLRDSEFTQFCNLCTDPGDLGRELMQYVTPVDKLTADVETELLVRAHFCHVLVGNMEGISSVLKHVRNRVDSFVKADQFKQLVRLLTGIKKYREMQYIFDILLQHDQFELVLSKVMDKGGQMELKMALYDYLKRYRPGDQERLQMVFLHFNMFREIGDTLNDKADSMLASLGEHAVQKSSELALVLQLYIEAADSYAKEECMIRSERCLAMARLIVLQVRLKQPRLLNLSHDEILATMGQLSKFYETHVLATAYGVGNHPVEWSRALFEQAVIAGNFTYCEDFRKVMTLNDALCQDLSQRYRSLPPQQRQQHALNMKKLLNFVEDVQTRYRIAQDLGFDDMLEALLSSTSGILLHGMSARTI